MFPVDGVSFGLREGASLGLVGESGSGKTLTALALVRLLPRAVRVARGRVELNGLDLLSAAEEEVRQVRGRKIAVVFQEPAQALNPVIRVGDQVAEAVAEGKEGGASERGERAVELFREVGLPDPERCARAYPHELSGGMRQRVLLAMALASNPKILVADEPTTALDATLQAELVALVDRVRRARLMSLLWISHDLAVVFETCEELAVLYRGRLVERGPAKEVSVRPLHPYTAGLLEASRSVRPLRGIPGNAPGLGKREAGCGFRPRCSRATEVCASVDPVLERKSESGWAACHHAGELR